MISGLQTDINSLNTGWLLFQPCKSSLNIGSYPETTSWPNSSRDSRDAIAPDLSFLRWLGSRRGTRLPFGNGLFSPLVVRAFPGSVTVVAGLPAQARWSRSRTLYGSASKGVKAVTASGYSSVLS